MTSAQASDQQVKGWITYPFVSSTQFTSTTIVSLTSLNNKTKTFATSGLYQVARSDSFAPKSIATGSPMFKVIGSSVVIDLNGMELKNTGTTSAGYIGIEIGYAPSEIGSNVQPTDVVIQNGTLTNFDLGLLIHYGVKNVLLKNIQINGTSLGLLCMGQSGAYHTNTIVGITCENVRITGHGANRRTALVNLKAKIENGSGNYNYGSGTFMPLRDDVVAGGDTNDVYTYFGVLAIYTRNVVFKNCVIQGIGYGSYDEGAGNRTEAVGVCVRNSTHMLCSDSYIERCVSQQKAVGMQIEASQDVMVEGSSITNNVSQKKSIGVECYKETPSGYNAENIVIKNSQFNLHSSSDTTYAIDASYTRDLYVQSCSCNRNYADKTVIGLYSTKMHFAEIKDCQMSANYTDTTSLATADGALACGIKLQGSVAADISSVTCNAVRACSNVGQNSGRGIYVKNAVSVDFKDVTCALNEGIALRTSESTDLVGNTSVVASHDQSVVEISRHLPVLTQTGGVGLWLENVTHVKAQQIQASYNKGIRATGILLRSCYDIHLLDSYASSQYATGECFSSLLSSETDTAVDIQDAHEDLLFGGAALTTVSAKAVTDDFLTKVGLVVTDHAANESYANMTMILNAMLLLQGAVARYRIWGTAVGVHAHNVVGMYIDNVQMLKNSSDKDSAIGLAFTGKVQGCEVRDCSCSYNTAWQDSVRTASAQSYGHTFELASVYPFWNMLADAGDLTGDGQWDEATGIADAGIESGGAPTNFVAQGESQDIRLATTARNLVNPVGPMAAGCLLADAALDVVLDNNVVHSNNGNSGSAFGIALCTSFSVVLSSNSVFNTYANSYGIAYGIADFTTHSATVYLNNKLAGNRWATYTNANYVIPFNASDPLTLSYQTTPLYNGNLSNADTMNTIENFDVKYSSNATYFHAVQSSIDPFVTADFVTQWDTQNWIP